MKLRTRGDRSPEFELNVEILLHLRQHRDSYGLMIIVYSGHGILRGPAGDQELELCR